MSNILWVFVLTGFVVAAAFSFVWLRRIATRIAAHSPRPRFIHRAAYLAATVAALPALFFATIIGGSLGARFAAEFSRGLGYGAFAEQAVMGVGVALGVSVIALIIVLPTGIAGAIFMKVYMAKADVGQVTSARGEALPTNGGEDRTHDDAL